MTTTTNRMTHNKERDQYIGEIRLCITVPGERYRQVFNQQISESPGLDLSDPEALELLRAKLADPLYWRGKPQATILELPADASPSPTLIPIKEDSTPSVHKTPSQHGSLRERVKEQAKVTPPHLWLETLQEPLPERETTGAITKEERMRRQVIWNRNHTIRAYLDILRTEWEQGTFVLSPEAQAAENEYQQTQQEKVTGKTTALALLTNSSRLVGNFAASANGVH